MTVINNNINRDLYRDFYSNSKGAQPPAIQNDDKRQQTKKQGIDLPVVATTIAGTLLPMFMIKSYQKTKLWKIEYGLKEMLFTSLGSITGGLTGGLLFSKNKKNEDKKAKVKESVFQFTNIAIPTSIVAGLLKLTEKSKNLKGVVPKIAAVVAGIGGGMPLAACISNNINNHIVDKDSPCKRKLCLKDCFVHVDDLIGALVLAKVPLVDKLHVDKILPAIYGLCGYGAGTKKEEHKNCIIHDNKKPAERKQVELE